MSERLKTQLCAGLLFCMTVWFFAPVVFSDKTFIARDNYTFYNPRQFYAADRMKAGEIPHWNPYNACGVPFQANMQNALFYPATLLYYVVPFQTGFKYYIIAHYFFAALFMFMLMRGWGKTRGAGIIAGMVFAFGGYMLSLNEAVAFLAAGSWLPLILLFHHSALKTGRPLYALLCGMAMGIQILAGDFSFYFGASLLCTLVYTMYWVFYKKESALLLKYFGFLLLAWLTAVLLAAVQVVPFAEYIYHSHRINGLSYEQATKWSFSCIEIIQLFIPKVLGTLTPQTKWAGQIWLDTIYTGAFSVILACVGVVFARNAIKTFLLVLIFLSIFFASGEYNPLYRYVFDWIPFVRMVQFPVKFLFIAAFSFSALAGIGAQEFCACLAARRKKAIFFAGLIALSLCPALLLLAATFYEDTLREYFSRIYSDSDYLRPFMTAYYYKVLEGTAVLLGFSALFLLTAYVVLIKQTCRQYFIPFVALIIFIDLFFFGKHGKPLVEESLILEKPATVAFLEEDETLFRIYPLARYAIRQSFLHSLYLPFEAVYRLLKEGQLANLNIYHKIQSADEYTEALNQHFIGIFGRVELYFKENLPTRKNIEAWNFTKKMLDLLNIKYLISPYNLAGHGLSLVKDDKIKIYKNPDALSRAILYDSIYILESDMTLLNFLTADLFDPRHMLAVPREEFNKINAWIKSNAAEGKEPFIWDVELKKSKQHKKRWLVKLQNTDTADQKILNGTTDVIEYSANRLRLGVNLNKSAFLFISDLYYPGWKAYINGQEAPIMRVNQAFRAIAVHKGSHTVEFVFKPLVFTIGAYTSIITLMSVLLALGGFYLQQHKKKSSTETASCGR